MPSQLLEQRAPFQFIDRVIEFDGERLECIKCVAANEWYLSGHFPEQPVVPGVLMVEMCAQAAMIFGRLRMGETSGEPPRGFLAKIDEFSFHRVAVPGDVLTIRVQSVRQMGSFEELRVRIGRHGTKAKIATGRVTVHVEHGE